MRFTDVTIVSVTGNDYKIHFLKLCKDEVINWILNNARLSKKYGSLTEINILINFLSMYKRLLIAILIIKEKEKIAGTSKKLLSSWKS